MNRSVARLSENSWCAPSAPESDRALRNRVGSPTLSRRRCHALCLTSAYSTKLPRREKEKTSTARRSLTTRHDRHAIV